MEPGDLLHARRCLAQERLILLLARDQLREEGPFTASLDSLDQPITGHVEEVLKLFLMLAFQLLVLLNRREGMMKRHRLLLISRFILFLVRMHQLRLQ